MQSNYQFKFATDLIAELRDRYIASAFNLNEMRYHVKLKKIIAKFETVRSNYLLKNFLVFKLELILGI